MAGYVSNRLFIYLSKLLGIWDSLIRPNKYQLRAHDTTGVQQ